MRGERTEVHIISVSKETRWRGDPHTSREENRER